MKITKDILLNSVITINECPIPNPVNLFESDKHLVYIQGESTFFDVMINNIKCEFVVSVNVEADCKWSISSGDGYITPNESHLDDYNISLELSDPYSEECELLFDINDSDINIKLSELIIDFITKK